MGRSAALLALLCFSACGRPALTDAGGAVTSTDETTGFVTSTSGAPDPTGGPSTSGAPDPTGGPSTSGAPEPSTTVSTGSPGDSDEGGADATTSTGGIDNGGSCQEDAECESGSCFVIPVLGGICGECQEDADCPEGGCTQPNPLQGVGATCNQGELGGGCQSDEPCSDELECALVLDIAGILTSRTCSECSSHADCGTGNHCVPEYDLAALTGQLVCRPIGSVPLGGGCFPEGAGDASCASPVCAEADVMGLFSVGICSQCEVDTDCGPDQACAEAWADVTTGELFAGYCEG